MGPETTFSNKSKLSTKDTGKKKITTKNKISRDSGKPLCSLILEDFTQRHLGHLRWSYRVFSLMFMFFKATGITIDLILSKTGMALI